MKLEDIIHMSADELEKMSDEELKGHFEKYFNITRPERQEKKPTNNNRPIPSFNPKLEEGKRLLASLGVDIGNALDKVKRRK